MFLIIICCCPPPLPSLSKYSFDLLVYNGTTQVTCFAHSIFSSPDSDISDFYCFVKKNAENKYFISVSIFSLNTSSQIKHSHLRSLKHNVKIFFFFFSGIDSIMHSLKLRAIMLVVFYTRVILINFHCSYKFCKS